MRGTQRNCESPGVGSSASLSACSSVSDGWKYSRRALYKFKPRYANASRGNSASSSIDSVWRSVDSRTWRSVDGVEFRLRGSRIDKLSDVEKRALQGIALQRLTSLIPNLQTLRSKEHTFLLRQKRQKLMRARGAQHVMERSRRGSASSTEDDRRVFGISLDAAVANERRLDHEIRCRSLDECEQNAGCSVSNRKWMFEKKAESVQSEPEMLRIVDEKNVLLLKEGGLQAVSSSSGCPSPERSFCRCASSESQSLNVPRLVVDCTDFLRKHGLNAVGLFRITGSAKRCRNLRSIVERSSAPNLSLLDSASPHDVATLLKEYLRDLPQPLFPTEYYRSFIVAARLSLEERIEALRLLVALLQPANIDTLYTLFKLLKDVSEHCNDELDADGYTLQKGNKMDARNLATIFAPSVLRPPQTTLCETLVENDTHITVVETMIEFVDSIFAIPKELQEKIFLRLHETDPDSLDRILQQLSRSAEQAEILPPPSPNIFVAMAEEESFEASCFGSSIGEDHSSHSSVDGESEGVVPSSRSRSWPFSLTRSPRLSRQAPCCENSTFSQAEATPSSTGTAARRRLQQVMRALVNIKVRTKGTHSEAG